MTSPSSAPWPSPGLVEQSPSFELSDDQVTALGLVFILVALVDQIRKAWEAAQRAHRRRALLEAYRRRHHWRKADVPRLLELNVGRPAMMRVNRIMDSKCPGRGVVRSYRPLDEACLLWVERICIFFDPTTSPKERLWLLKQTVIWPHVVEALYRGERAAAKVGCRKSPSASAEEIVADHLGISQALVHKLCIAARQEQSRNEVSGLWPALCLTDFDVWAQHGRDFGGDEKEGLTVPKWTSRRHLPATTAPRLA